MSRACHRFSAGSGGAGVLLARLASFCFAAMCVARVVCARSARKWREVRSGGESAAASPALASFHVLAPAKRSNTAPLKETFLWGRDDDNPGGSLPCVS